MCEVKQNPEELFEMRFAHKPLLRLPDINNRMLHPTIGSFQQHRKLKESDVTLVSGGADYVTKTEEFEKRTIELSEKANAIKQWMTKYDNSFLQNERKKFRALMRYEREKEARIEKERELERLKYGIELLQKLETKMEAKIEMYGIYKKFLEDVVQVSKRDEFEKPRDVSNRYDSLLQIRDNLTQRIKDGRKAIDDLRAEKTTYTELTHAQILADSKRLVELRSKYDTAYTRASACDSKWKDLQDNATENTLLLTQIKLAISNLRDVVMTKVPKRILALFLDAENVTINPRSDNPMDQLFVISYVLEDMKCVVTYATDESITSSVY